MPRVFVRIQRQEGAQLYEVLLGRTLIAHQSDKKGPILDVRIACEAGGSLTSLYEVLLGRTLVVHHS